MRYITIFVFIAFSILYSKDKEAQSMKSCINDENFEIVYTYLIWKKATAKKLSDYGKVIVEDDYDAETIDEEEKRIVFTVKNYKQFSVIQNKGFQPHTKNANDYERNNELYCNLATTAKMKALPKNNYRYIDGNGNVWKISEKEMKYEPIKPAMSSSGIYSGGKAFKMNLEEDKFNELKVLLEKAILNQSSQIENRVKGSGLVVKLITEGVIEKSVILNEKSIEKKNIEKFLTEFKNNSP
ncbi:MAG: hypothetical protein SFU98_08985 [Leptospiraceae bacterium]|nr:hypothetical protein [Leptospiraceae bacterium]